MGAETQSSHNYERGYKRPEKEDHMTPYYHPTLTINWGNDHCLSVNVEASPYDPGRRSGPPEHCYPPEGGLESINSISLVKVFIHDGQRKEKARKLPAACVDKLADNDQFWIAVEEALDESARDD